MEWIEFWDAEGLRTVAELIEAELKKHGRNKNVLERESGVSRQTIANLLKNLNNSPGQPGWTPQPEIILNLAQAISNPDAGGEKFKPRELLAIATGDSRLKSAIHASERYLVQNLPYPAAVVELWRLIGTRTVERAARDWGVPASRLNELLRSDDPIRATPTYTEIARIVSKSYDDKLANRLINLYADQNRLPHAN